MMKLLFILITLSITSNMNAQDGKAVTVKKTFNRTTTVSQEIDADAEKVWSLLTDAKSMVDWNSTIISIEGMIVEGEKIKLKSTLAQERTFKLKVKEMNAQTEMVWGDGMGKRTYSIEKTGEGVRFTMKEKIGNFMFPLFANKIPSFDAMFEQFAKDLKQAAEN